MNFNLVEMYNGLLRFNKHILNELAEGLKHLPNLDGVSIGNAKFHRELPIQNRLKGCGTDGGSAAGSGGFYSTWVRSDSVATVGFFTTVKLD